MPSPCRTVIESERFTRELKYLFDDPVRADEFVESVKIALAREPDLAEAICLHEKPPLWFVPCSSCDDIVIYYTFDENEVTLLSIIDGSKL